MALDLELRTFSATSFDLSDTSSETTLYEGTTSRRDLMAVESPPEDTRFKTRLLTYVRQNYLNIFLTLLSVIIFLLALVAVLIYIFLTAMPTKLVVPVHQDQALQSEVLTTTPDLMTSTIPGENPWLQNKPCRKVKCNNTSCRPENVDYDTIRGYTCCSCYDPNFTFRRFEYDFLRNRVSLIFQVPEVITSVSKQDLANMPQLPHLVGTWNKQQESDTAWYFVYEGISVPEQPPDDRD